MSIFYNVRLSSMYCPWIWAMLESFTLWNKGSRSMKRWWAVNRNDQMRVNPSFLRWGQNKEGEVTSSLPLARAGAMCYCMGAVPLYPWSQVELRSSIPAFPLGMAQRQFLHCLILSREPIQAAKHIKSACMVWCELGLVQAAKQTLNRS